MVLLSVVDVEGLIRKARAGAYELIDTSFRAYIRTSISLQHRIISLSRMHVMLVRLEIRRLKAKLTGSERIAYLMQSTLD